MDVGRAAPRAKNSHRMEERDGEFQDFYAQCIRRFIRVEYELYALCVKLTRFKEPLDAFVESAR